MDWNAIAAIAACTAVLGTLFVMWRQNKATKLLMSRQLFLELAAEWDSSYMQQKRAQLAKTLLEKSDGLQLDDTVLIFFETLAHMERKGIIDPELVKTTFVVDISFYWLATRHYVFHIRDKLSEDRFFEEMAELSDRLYREYTALNPSSKIGHPSALRDFLEWEARRG